MEFRVSTQNVVWCDRWSDIWYRDPVLFTRRSSDLFDFHLTWQFISYFVGWVSEWVIRRQDGGVSTDNKRNWFFIPIQFGRSCKSWNNEMSWAVSWWGAGDSSSWKWGSGRPFEHVKKSLNSALKLLGGSSTLGTRFNNPISIMLCIQTNKITRRWFKMGSPWKLVIKLVIHSYPADPERPAPLLPDLVLVLVLVSGQGKKKGDGPERCLLITCFEWTFLPHIKSLLPAGQEPFFPLLHARSSLLGRS